MTAHSRLCLDPLPVHQSVESVVMSRFFQRGSIEDFQTFKADWDKKFAAVELTVGQKLALFTLRRSALSSLIVEKLKASTVRAGQNEFDWLKSNGFAIQHHSGKFLMLTPQGHVRAGSLERIAAKELDLHFFTQGGSRYQSFVACACGWSYHHSKNEGHERSAFARRTSEHLRSVGVEKASIVAGDGPAPDWVGAVAQSAGPPQ